VSATTTVHDGGIRWTLDPAFADAFAGLRIDWSDLPSDERTRTVKSGPARAVYAFVGDKASLHIKEYRRPTWFDRLRFLFRRSAGRVERETSARLAERGIPVPKALALGEGRLPGGRPANFLVTETIPGVIPLDRWVLDIPDKERAQLARLHAAALGIFVRRLHDAGVLHRDFHAGNILVAQREPAPAFYLSDLHDVALRDERGGLAKEERFDNLVIFNRFWSLCVNAAARRRFLAAYEGDRPLGLDARSLERATLESNKAFWQRRDRRCTRTNKYFICENAVGRRWRLRRPWTAKTLADALDRSPECTLKHGRTTRVSAATLDGPDGPCELVFKRYNPKGLFWALRYSVRRSGGLRSWRAANALVTRHVPTAVPVAAWERRAGPILFDSGVVTERLAGAEELHAFVASTLAKLKGKEKLRARRRTAALLATLLRNVHDRGLTHRDLKASNLLVVRDGAGVRDVFLIDLDGLRIVGDVTGRRRVKDLARLARSLVSLPEWRRSDGLRVLRTYLGMSGRDRETLRAWWRRLAVT